jgi:hypothetical protein
MYGHCLVTVLAIENWLYIQYDLLFSLMLTYVILTLYFNGKAPRMGTSVLFAPLPFGYFQMYLYIFININQ